MEAGEDGGVIQWPVTVAEELTQLLSLTGAEVVDDPWELAGHGARHKLVLRCVNSDTQPPTPAEIELFNGQQSSLYLCLLFADSFRLVFIVCRLKLDSVYLCLLSPDSFHVVSIFCRMKIKRVCTCVH